MHESSPEPGDTRPTMRFGIADPDGRIVDTVQTTSLVDTVRLFEDLAEQGFRCTPGQSYQGMDLLRVFEPAAPTLLQTSRRGHHE